MKTFLSALISLLFTLPLYAGAGGTATFKAKSGTGRTTIEIRTTDIDQAVSYLKFTIDGKSYEFDLKKGKDTYGYIIHDSKNKVFTVFIDNEQIDFKFWIVPKTKKSLDANNWEYEAYVEATDPRDFSDKTRNKPMAPAIHLRGTMTYDL